MMLLLLSPAKKQGFQDNPAAHTTTTPDFLEQSIKLVTTLKTHSPAGLAKLMHISDHLAQLNYERFQAFSLNNWQDHATPALLTFQGDAYQSLHAQDFNAATLQFAQVHLRILSGLYGLLRPLDTLLPYRLEMKTRIKTTHAKNLYDFWSHTLTSALHAEIATHQHSCVVNLASKEYSQAIDFGQLTVPCIDVRFLELRNGSTQTIGIYAKRARGLMSRFLLTQQATDPKTLQTFSLDGYMYDAKRSDDTHAVFIRTHAT